MKIYLGDKFYRYIESEDKVSILRITRIKNENSFVLEDETKNVVRLDKSTLLDNYTRLKPDGYLTYSIVELQDKMKDVIVALHRRSDIENGMEIPYCACRQNIFDLFTNQTNKVANMIYVGVSVSLDTIPENTPYNMVLACNSVSHSVMTSVYMEDTLETLLSLVKQDKFDNVLHNLNKDVSNLNVRGYCSNLRQLLSENNFMYDFLRAFNIYQVPLDIKVINDELEIGQRNILQDMLKVEMFKTYVLAYDKEVDLKKIQRDYILISDINNKLYIVAYDKGSYINPAYQKNIQDKRDAVAMLKSKKSNK